MPRRALWKGFLTFAGVSLGVKLHTMVRKEQVRFHLLHARDSARLSQVMVCPADGRIVERSHQVQGSRVGEQAYILVDPQELKAAEPEPSREIDVQRFVDPVHIDPRYFDRTYLLSPDGDAERYTALVQALRRTGTMGLCRWVMRTKHYLGALTLQGRALCLVSLRWPEEIIPADQLDLPEAGLTDKEKRTASLLIREMSGEFEPGRYRNEYQERLKEYLSRKARGEEMERATPWSPEVTPSETLIDSLEQSLERVRAEAGHG